MVVEGALEGELDDHLGYASTTRRAVMAAFRQRRAKTGQRSRAGEDQRAAGPGFQFRAENCRQKAAAADRSGLHGDFPVGERADARGDYRDLAEVYDAEVSKQTITAITDRAMEGLADWQAGPRTRWMRLFSSTPLT